MDKEIFDILKTKIKGDILFDEATLQKYSKDTSLFSVTPSAVVFPKNVLDIENIVHFVNDYKHSNHWLSITPRSAGTCMSGGAIGEGLIVDFTKYINKFEINPSLGKASVQPGVYYRDFEKETLKDDLIMPVFPASKDLAAIGGMVSNNCAGEKSLQYGQIRNFVKRSKVILSNGREYEFKKIYFKELQQKTKEDSFIGGIYRSLFTVLDKNYEKIKEAKPKTIKNSSGYALWDVYDREKGTFDINQLFVGAQGTLGIITQVDLDLVKIKKHKKLVSIFLKSWNDLPEVVNNIIKTNPMSLETFDDTTMMLGLRFFPEIAKKAKIPLFKFVLGFLPEFWMSVKLLRMPKLIILAEFEEDSEDILVNKIIDLEESLKNSKAVFRVIDDEKEAEKYFIIRRESFNLLRHKVNGKQTAPFIDDFCISPEKLPEFLPKFLNILKKYEIKANIAGHAGEGNLHIIPLMNLKKETERAKILPCADEVYDLIIEFGGTITAEHNDGIMRTPYVEKMFGAEIYKIFEEVKKIFDPNNIFNPGKKVGGSKEFLKNHIKTD